MAAEPDHNLNTRHLTRWAAPGRQRRDGAVSGLPIAAGRYRRRADSRVLASREPTTRTGGRRLDTLKTARQTGGHDDPVAADPWRSTPRTGRRRRCPPRGTPAARPSSPPCSPPSPPSSPSTLSPLFPPAQPGPLRDLLPAVRRVHGHLHACGRGSLTFEARPVPTAPLSSVRRSVRWLLAQLEWETRWAKASARFAPEAPGPARPPRLPVSLSPPSTSMRARGDACRTPRRP